MPCQFEHLNKYYTTQYVTGLVEVALGPGVRISDSFFVGLLSIFDLLKEKYNVINF